MRLRLLLLLPALMVGMLLWAAPSHAGTQVAWCGGVEELSADRPDTVNGLQFHVLYAYASDAPNRFPTLVNGIVGDVSDILGWWPGQDPTRNLRVDLAAFANCPGGVAALDVTVVKLPRPGAEYQANATTLKRIIADLNAAGYGHPDKKMLVYYDGPYDHPKACGEALSGFIDGGRSGYAAVYLSTFVASGGGCGADTGVVALHEVIHAQNTLPSPFPNPGPPNVCGTSQGGEEDLGHPCDSTLDIMFPSAGAGSTFLTQLLDVNNDDYYNHSGSWWDVRDSQFLQRLDSADTTPPGALNKKKVTATSVKRDVTFRWPKASGGPLLGYRVYVNGVVFKIGKVDRYFTTKKRKLNVSGNTKINGKKIAPKLKRIVELGVRAIDPSGNLGPLREIRFRVGVGIVNAKGKLIKDTVPPSSPKLKAPRFVGSGYVMSWTKASDLGGKVKSYELLRNKRVFATLTGNTRSTTVPFGSSRGTWTIRARDPANNGSIPRNSWRIG